ncbi:MAG TPA: antitoxin family protein, partial [Roseiflexaceae bacterium]|nr:antitoxin family protein [Roseiflexaceae bacterium]
MPDQPDEPLLLELPEPPAPQSPALACDAVYRRGLLRCATRLDLPHGTPVAVQAVVPVHSEPYLFDTRYEQGALRPLQPLDLPDGTALRLYFTLQVSALALPVHQSGGAAPAATRSPNSNGRAWPAPQSLAAGLLGSLALSRSDNLVLALVMLVYAITRFVGLVAYPIFFFCDEAIQTNLADYLLHHGLTDQNGVFLPPFFRNVDKWNLSLSVYMQAIGLMLFGKSVFVNRATSVVVSMLGVIAVALTLRLIFRARLWWAGALAMSAIPVW